MNSIKSVRHIFVIPAIFLLLFFGFSSAIADGPVGVSSLPGGVSFADSDDGSGESWGRVGGRDFSFNNFDTNRFDTLTWGPVNNLAVGIALDGTINNGSQELLSLNSTTINEAIWIGSTQVLVVSGSGAVVSTPVETRFVLTVTSGGGPVNLETDTTNGLPYVNVIAANGQFVANLRMEARLSSGATWEGVLDLFDRLSTTGDGLAITSFNHGFFFDLAGGGSGGDLTLEEHDTNMVNQAGSLAGDLEFLTIESVNRLTDLNDRTRTIEDLVHGIGNDELVELLNRAIVIDALLRDLTDLHGGDGEGGEPSLDEIVQQISDSKDELVQIITFLWGISPGGDGFPDPSTIPQISDLSTQQSLDDLTDLFGALVADQNLAIAELKQQLLDLQSQLDGASGDRELRLEVVESHKGSGKMTRLLLLVRENGSPIEPHNLSVNAVVDDKQEGFTTHAVDFIQTSLGEGLIEIAFDLRKPLKYARIFHITAQHDHGDGDIHSGATILADDDKH